MSHLRETKEEFSKGFLSLRRSGRRSDTRPSKTWDWLGDIETTRQSRIHEHGVCKLCWEIMVDLEPKSRSRQDFDLLQSDSARAREEHFDNLYLWYSFLWLRILTLIAVK